MITDVHTTLFLRYSNNHERLQIRRDGDRQVDSSIPREHSFCRGINKTTRTDLLTHGAVVRFRRREDYVKYERITCGEKKLSFVTTNIIFVAFVKDNATMSSIRYFENHVSYFVQNRRQ